MYSNVFFLPGHSLTLQLLELMTGPLHSLPPWAGEGLVHDRVLDCVPSPQVLEQAPNDVHCVNPPLTEEVGKEYRTWTVIQKLISFNDFDIIESKNT